MNQDHDRLFGTEDVKDRVAHNAARGAAALAFAKPIKAVTSLVFVATLARLLTPADFGLVAMVAVVTRFIDVFRDAGLSNAIIQREGLTGPQLNAVFWVNVAISASLGVVLIVGSPGVAWFYDEPRLIPVTVALGCGLLLSGTSIQHRALLRRRMRFLSIVSAELVAFIVSNLVAVWMALLGFRYWALVARSLTETVVLGAGLWLSSGWHPSLPRRAPGTGALLKFGANLTGFNVLNFLSRNMDNVLVGRFFGAAALGVYQKAYDLMMLSAREVMRPAGTVAISALSRIAGDDERYRRGYFRIVDKLLLVTTPFAALMLAAPDWLVGVLLGKQWESVIPLAQVFGITALLQPLSATVGWLLMTQDRTTGMLRLGVLTTAFNLTLFAVGSIWGVYGIAVAYSLGQLLRTPLSLSYAAHQGPVGQRDMYTTLFTFTFTGIVAALSLWAVRHVLPPMGPFVGLTLSCVIVGLSGLGVLLLLPRGRAALKDVPRGARLLLSRRGKKRSADDGS
jgi:PST family polysaccharide transporter